MKKSRSLIIAVTFFLQPVITHAQQETAVAVHGKLAVKGNAIVDEHGVPTQLRGMSFFWSQWMGQYYTADAVKALKEDWNCNVVRAVMGVETGGYLDHPEREKQKIITVVDEAIRQGIYVIIDWHDHRAQNHVKEAKAFFAEMAQRYGDKPNVLYELYNEPVNVPWLTVIKPYHEAIIDTIRHYDADNLILCGTPTWSQDVDVASHDPIKGTNIAYTLHFYANTHKQALRDKAMKALNNGVALFVTEYGTTDASGNGFVNKDETRIWWKFMDDHKISWCNWSLADKNESSSSLKTGMQIKDKLASTQLTESGNFVRDELRLKNPQGK